LFEGHLIDAIDGKTVELGRQHHFQISVFGDACQALATGQGRDREIKLHSECR